MDDLHSVITLYTPSRVSAYKLLVNFAASTHLEWIPSLTQLDRIRAWLLYTLAMPKHWEVQTKLYVHGKSIDSLSLLAIYMVRG